MKTISFFSLTSSGTFLFTEGNQKRQGSFEGLNFDNSILSRFALRPYMRKSFDCKFGKSNTKIRYQNIQFYEEMLKLNVAKINPEQFEESKIFNSEEKQRLKKLSKQIDTQKVLQLSKRIMDYSADRKLLPQLYSKCRKLSAFLQYLSDELIIWFEQQEIVKFVPLKLRNIDHYFQLIQKLSLSRILLENKPLEIQFVSCNYNLTKKQYEIQAILSEQYQKMILQQGWGTIALKNINLMRPKVFADYRKTQNNAKIAHKGIFAKPFEILSLIYTKNNLVAVVEEIIEGYIFKIRGKNNQVIKIELSKIYCPIQNQAGSFVCRQFARKNLIGKQVNVFLTKDEGLNILGSIVRFSDNKDIQTLMIQNGYGFVKQQLKGTMFYAKLQTLQKKARDQKRGIHNEKSVGFQYYEDFTVAHSKKQKLDKKNSIQSKERYLNQLQNGQEAVIQKCIDLVTYIVRVDSHKKMVKVRLDGVSKLVSNPRLPQVHQLQKNSQSYCYRNFHQRTVNLQLNEYDSNNNYFIGVIKQSGKGKEQISFQQALLNQGLVILHNSGFFEQKWVECQKVARQKKLGCWNQNLKHFIRNDLYQQEGKQFKGKFSWVEDGQLAYIQPNSASQRLDFVYESLNNPIEPLKTVKAEDLIPGYVCAAQYQGEICRARIVSVTGKSISIKFVDWGNKQNVQPAKLFDIPLKLQYIPALCCQVLLDLVKPINSKEKEHLERLRQYLMEFQCNFVKLYGNIVNVFSQQNHINSFIVYEGYIKADLTKIHDETTKIHMTEQMDRLRKELVGIWEVENNDSDFDQPDQ